MEEEDDDDEDRRWFQLSTAAKSLSAADIESLEEQLEQDPLNMDVRVQIFSYYGRYEGNKLKHKNAEQKLSEHILWLIKNKPTVRGYLQLQISTKATNFRPKSFAALRQAWLEQVSANPLNGTILGNAASFIVWRDFETASELFERAYALQPEAGWFGTFVIHCNSELWHLPALYADSIRRRIIYVGLRSLETESGGAVFLTCDYVSDTALSLGFFDIVRDCADKLRVLDPTSEQMANAYLGLVALRQNNRARAVELMLEMKRGYQPQEIVFRLARELFDLGERESIVQLIKSFKRKIRTSARKRWIDQVENDERPDFSDWCVCSACMEKEAKLKRAL